MMREIHGVALGTYYAAGADAAIQTPHASDMRGLLYALKDNRAPPNPPQRICHPRHPSYPAGTLVDRGNAVDFAVTIVDRYRTRIASLFGSRSDAITLVPVPSSQVTSASVETARFPTLRLCRALAARGFGVCRVLAVQRSAVPSKTTGHRRPGAEILANLERTPEPSPQQGVVVLVDDNVQSGQSLAAVDRLLATSCPVAAFAVAVTDSRPRFDACVPRRFRVTYDERQADAPVTLRLGR
jgi:hypothetical protein